MISAEISTILLLFLKGTGLVSFGCGIVKSSSMGTGAEFDTNPSFLPRVVIHTRRVIIRTRRVARYRLIRMDDYMDLAPESSGVEWNPQDEGLQCLYNGIQLGFNRVMAKLSEVDGHLDSVPTKTADALAGQRGLSEGEDSERANALAVS